MCPVILFSLILCLLLAAVEVTAALTISFSPSAAILREKETLRVNFTIQSSESPQLHKPDEEGLRYYQLNIKQPDIADVVDGQYFIPLKPSLDQTGHFNLQGKFLGLTQLYLVPVNKLSNGSYEPINPSSESNALDITVKRSQSLVSLIFTISVASLVSLNYINMGCALDLVTVKSVLRAPVAPLVGFVSQYLFMPISSFLLGLWLLPDSTHLRLGLFIFGCSPAGGASNMWTVLLNGNLDLSVTMTFISTIAGVAMLPLWMYTLGRQVYSETQTTVPVRNILTTLVSMAFFLGIGLLFQKYLPRIARVCKRILAPVSISMIIFIVIFGTYANWYMFKLMTWQILISAGLNVWIGFLGGLLVAIAIRLPLKDIIAISIETGIQNTGIAIVLLGFSLPEPNNDIASVVPVAASIMTPIPLTIVWIAMKCFKLGPKGLNDEDDEKGHSKKLSSDEASKSISSSSALLPGPSVASTPIHLGPTELTSVNIGSGGDLTLRSTSNGLNNSPSTHGTFSE